MPAEDDGTTMGERPADGTTMGERPAAVIAKAKAAAAQACEQAKAKAKLVQGKDAVDAQRVAQQMCDQMKAEVEEGIHKLKAQAAQNAVVNADDYGDDKVKADIEKAQANANGGGFDDASRLKQTLRKVAKAAQQRVGPVKTPRPGAVGAMPAEVANKIA